MLHDSIVVKAEDKEEAKQLAEELIYEKFCENISQYQGDVDAYSAVEE